MTGHRIPVTGGCLCGAIRYESSAPPVKGFCCHCTKCQKTYGGIFQPMFKFAGEDFRFVKGDLKYYSSSTFAKRGFCVECGSGIVFLYEGNDALYIMTGTLDHPGDWPMTSDAAWGPTIHCYFDTKVPWYEIRDGLTQCHEVPGAAAAQLHAASRPA